MGVEAIEGEDWEDFRVVISMILFYPVCIGRGRGRWILLDRMLTLRSFAGEKSDNECET